MFEWREGDLSFDKYLDGNQKKFDDLITQVSEFGVVLGTSLMKTQSILACMVNHKAILR